MTKDSEKYKVLTVNFQRTFPIAQYGINVRVGGDIELQEGQTLEGALDWMNGKVEAWAKQNIPEPELTYTSFPVQTRTIPEYDPVYKEKETEEFLALKKIIEDTPTKDLALKFLEKSNFKYNIELKKIINGKGETK